MEITILQVKQLEAVNLKKNMFKIKVGHIGYLMMNLLSLFLIMAKVEMNGLK